MSELLKAAVADGDLRADVDIRMATRLLFGMVNSLVEWYRPQPGGSPEREQLADTVVQLAFDGMRASR